MKDVETRPASSSSLSITTRDEVLVPKLSNVSAMLPPADFAIEVNGGSQIFGNVGVFLLTLDSLGTLAKLPYDRRTPKSLIDRLRTVPGIAIRMKGQYPQGGFAIKHMIWGLTLAFKHMVDRNQFRNWHFTLRLRNTIVGFLSYESSPEDAEPNDFPTWIDLAQNELVIPQPATDNENINFDITIKDIPGSNLNLNDVMMVMIGGITDIAIHDFDQKVSNDYFGTWFTPYRAYMELSPSAPPPSSPLWFTYGTVRLIIGKLAWWYVCHQPCKPAQLLMLRDGLYSGHGYVTDNQANLGPTDGTEVERNITTS
ncbi:MAG: hypothetical protein Q9225_005047 [Loekoesia sp. 1 TL-2023]